MNWLSEYKEWRRKFQLDWWRQSCNTKLIELFENLFILYNYAKLYLYLLNTNIIYIYIFFHDCREYLYLYNSYAVNLLIYYNIQVAIFNFSLTLNLQINTLTATHRIWLYSKKIIFHIWSVFFAPHVIHVAVKVLRN